MDVEGSRDEHRDQIFGVAHVRFGVIRVDFDMSASCLVGGNLRSAGCLVLPIEGIGWDVIQAMVSIPPI
jgi:hypothetical protein